jgi:hypothetical protein
MLLNKTTDLTIERVEAEIVNLKNLYDLSKRKMAREYAVRARRYRSLLAVLKSEAPADDA